MKSSAHRNREFALSTGSGLVKQPPLATKLTWVQLDSDNRPVYLPSEARRAELIEAVRNGSISTYKHVNLHGESDFSDEKMADSVCLASPKNQPLKTD